MPFGCHMHCTCTHYTPRPMRRIFCAENWQDMANVKSLSPDQQRVLVSLGSLGLRHGARVCQLTSTRVPAHACWSLLYVSASGIRLYVPASGIRKHMPLLWTWSEGSMPTSSSMTMPSHIIRPCNPTHSSDACKRRRQSCNGSTLHLAMRIPHNASGSVHLGSCKFLSPFTLNPKPSPDSCAVRASPAEI